MAKRLPHDGNLWGVMAAVMWLLDFKGIYYLVLAIIWIVFSLATYFAD